MRSNRQLTIDSRKSWRLRWGFLFLILVCSSLSASAQDVKVNGGFLSDSLKIGEQTAFYLAARYPSELNLLFPDSTFGFNPFEFQKRTYFPTKTENGVSIDSAVYYLTTFEVDRVQYLHLPVFVVQPQDCTVLDSFQDSVLITQLVASVPDSLSIDKLPLKMNTAYQEVDFQFNYWIAIIATGVLILIAILTWIFFGKRIRAWMIARKLKKRHYQFIQVYNSNVIKLKSGFSPATTESALSSWKKYMEQLEAQPYTKLTTRETLRVTKDEQLAKTLHTVDEAIYGHNTAVIESLETLRGYADQRFSKKLEEVKHG